MSASTRNPPTGLSRRCQEYLCLAITFFWFAIYRVWSIVAKPVPVRQTTRLFNSLNRQPSEVRFASTVRTPVHTEKPIQLLDVCTYEIFTLILLTDFRI